MASSNQKEPEASFTRARKRKDGVRALCTHCYDAFRRGYALRRSERDSLSRGFVYKQNREERNWREPRWKRVSTGWEGIVVVDKVDNGRVIIGDKWKGDGSIGNFVIRRIGCV